jgi:membrane protein
MVEPGTSTNRDNAPAPEDPRKPDGPTDLKKPSSKFVLKKTIHEFSSDQCTDIAASLTYYGVLALFPALIAIVSLLGVFGLSDAALEQVLGIAQSVVPADVLDTIRGPLEAISASPGAGFALVTGILVALWSASGYVGAFSRAMNRIYEIDEGRPFWKLRPMQLIVTIIAVVLILIVALLLVVSGPVTEAIGDALGLGEAVQTVWSIAKWPVIAIAVILILAVLYYATPNAKQPKFRWMSLGALLALVVLVIASAAFALYLGTFANYDKTYGSLAGVIVFLLWLWIANLALLFGAEFDAELERGRQLQAGITAEEQIQLSPRDTRASEKAEKTEQRDQAEGRRIRRQHQDSRRNDHRG